MRLEDEIKQEEFNSEFQKLTLNLIFTYSWTQSRRRNFFQKYSLTPQQYNVLRILRGHHPEPYSTSQIRERMLDKMSDASRIVERLCRKDLVERKTCEKDKRLVDVVITKQGLSLLNDMDEGISKMDSIFKNISEQDARILNQLLDKIRG